MVEKNPPAHAQQVFDAEAVAVFTHAILRRLEILSTLANCPRFWRGSSTTVTSKCGAVSVQRRPAVVVLFRALLFVLTSDFNCHAVAVVLIIFVQNKAETMLNKTILYKSSNKNQSTILELFPEKH